MCALSAMMGGFNQPNHLNYPLFQQATQDAATAAQLLEIIRKLDALDKKVGLLECEVSDDLKNKYIKLLEEKAATSVG